MSDKVIKENQVFFLYRRGNPAHITALYETGELYINTIDFIRECDENEDRSDPYDGISTRKYFSEIEVRMCEVGQTPNENSISLHGFNAMLIRDSTEKGNIYCLSGIYSEHFLGERSDLTFDTRAFGESLILIHNPREFIARVEEALKVEGYENVTSDRVSYHANNYSGRIGFFKKHEKFRHQNEYRFFIPNNRNEPIKIKLGSLRDIATIENNTFITLTYTDNKEQIITIG